MDAYFPPAFFPAGMFPAGYFPIAPASPPRDVPTDLEGEWDEDDPDDSPDPDWALWEED